MDTPSNSKRVRNIEQLKKYFMKGLKMIHVAVKRCLPYYHHYVILAEKSTWNTYLKIVQYTGGPSDFISGGTCGKVEETNIPISQVEENICDGMYVITGTHYPQEAIDFVEACSRYMFRLGEKAYHIVYNNCEHLANYIMTGNPKCEQIKQSGPFKKGVAETLDMITSEGKSNILRILIDTAGSTVAAQQFVRTASKQVFSAASWIALRNTARVGTSAMAQNLINFTADNIPTCISAEQMLCSETCCEAAETAGKYALRKTAFATGVLTVAVEAGFAAWQINNLRKMKKAGEIQDRDFKREKAKVVVTVPVVSSLTVAGSVIGQALCPVPGIGACLGGLVANCIGRWGAGVVTGRFFDWWWP